jgi:hypothetical protein
MVTCPALFSGTLDCIWKWLAIRVVPYFLMTVARAHSATENQIKTAFLLQSREVCDGQPAPSQWRRPLHKSPCSARTLSAMNSNNFVLNDGRVRFEIKWEGCGAGTSEGKSPAV